MFSFTSPNRRNVACYVHQHNIVYACLHCRDLCAHRGHTLAVIHVDKIGHIVYMLYVHCATHICNVSVTVVWVCFILFVEHLCVDIRIYAQTPCCLYICVV